MIAGGGGLDCKVSLILVKENSGKNHKTTQDAEDVGLKGSVQK